MAQLVIVSNRVAIPEKNAKARAGGLEVAVKAALKHKSGIWFGWSGKVATLTKIATQRVMHDGITYITLDLSKEDHHEYYHGFTNRVLWPILHYRVDLAEFSRRDLSGYLRVNDHFARELHEVLGPDDLVWVHDYHLIPLAKALRESTVPREDRILILITSPSRTDHIIEWTIGVSSEGHAVALRKLLKCSPVPAPIGGRSARRVALPRRRPHCPATHAQLRPTIARGGV